MMKPLLVGMFALVHPSVSLAIERDCLHRYAHMNKLVVSSAEENGLTVSIARWDGKTKPLFTDCKIKIISPTSGHPLAGGRHEYKCQGITLSTRGGILYSVIHGDKEYELRIDSTWTTRNNFEKAMGKNLYSECRISAPLTIQVETSTYSFQQSSNLLSPYLVIKTTEKHSAQLKPKIMF